MIAYNTQYKGDVAVAMAIATFTAMGYVVGVLVTESAPYDLLVDIGESVKRVQVKYTSSRSVDLRSIHSNAGGYVVKLHKNGAYDWLYVYTSTGEEFINKRQPSSRHLAVSKMEALPSVKQALLKSVA